MDNAIEVSTLTVNYEKTQALWDISFSVPKGSLVGVIGPNGAGKSTLIKALLGLENPLSGKVTFFNKPLKEMRKKIAYIPQKESVDWNFPITALELVLMGRYGSLGIFRWPRKADKEAAKEALEMVGMGAFSDRQISQLSGGQQQRIFIARALIQNADIYFMDEPFSGVDLATEKMIVELFKKLKANGKTVFVVHHDLNSVENYFDWVIMLNLSLVKSGPTKDVFNSENLSKTFGSSHNLLSDMATLSRKKTAGIE